MTDDLNDPARLTLFLLETCQMCGGTSEVQENQFVEEVSPCPRCEDGQQLTKLGRKLARLFFKHQRSPY